MTPDGVYHAVTVVIPTLNEEPDIEGCIAAVGNQDVEGSMLEVLVVDGGSDDRTAERALRAATSFEFARFELLPNPSGRTAIGLNIGLESARGTYLVRVDARSRIPPWYVSRCVEVLATRPDVAVVGGAQIPIARSSSSRERGIARALGNRLTSGLSRYRRSVRSGVSDTVWMGAFRVEDLRAIGGWRGDLSVNEDYELNQRLRRSRGIVWFDASLESGYLARPTVAAILYRHYRYGCGKGELMFGTGLWATRHWVLLSAPVISAAVVVAGFRRSPMLTVLSAVGAAYLTDALGARGQSNDSLVVRTWAVASMAGVALGWWTGAVRGITTALVRRLGVQRTRPSTVSGLGDNQL